MSNRPTSVRSASAIHVKVVSKITMSVSAMFSFPTQIITCRMDMSFCVKMIILNIISLSPQQCNVRSFFIIGIGGPTSPMQILLVVSTTPAGTRLAEQRVSKCYPERVDWVHTYDRQIPPQHSSLSVFGERTSKRSAASS